MFQDFLGEKYIHDNEKKELLENIIESKIGKKIDIKMVLAADMSGGSQKLYAVSVEEKLREKIHNIEIEVDDSPVDAF